MVQDTREQSGDLIVVGVAGYCEDGFPPVGETLHLATMPLKSAMHFLSESSSALVVMYLHTMSTIQSVACFPSMRRFEFSSSSWWSSLHLKSLYTGSLVFKQSC